VTAQNGALYSPFNSWLLSDPLLVEHIHLDSGLTHDATCLWVQRQSGARLGIFTVASFFDRNDLTPGEVAAVHTSVVRALQRQPGWEDVYLLDTPARTGLDLWRTTFGFHRVDGVRQPVTYPLLDAPLRTRIRAKEGQGRFEYLSPSDGQTEAMDLFLLDGRFMYAAPAMAELGCGPAKHDTQPDYAGFQPARYSITYRVPEGWEHLGLFMTPDPSGGWWYPRTPGEMGETWADASELRIALGPFPHRCPNCERCYRVNDGERCPAHGWPFTIQERILYTQGRPLRAFAEKIVAARESCTNPAARAALRNILLRAIGALHGNHRPATHIARSDEAPDGVPLRALLLPDGTELLTWEEPAEAPPAADCDHPEFSSQIWAKARARLLLHRDYDTKQFTGALTLPFDAIVHLRLDGMLTTVDPGWPDSGRPGVLRLKGHASGPFKWPRDEDDMAALKARMDSQAAQEKGHAI
jgi:hypothetical protein